MLLKISVYRRDFDETKYMSFLTKNFQLPKNIMKFGTARLLRRHLIVNLYTNINI